MKERLAVDTLVVGSYIENVSLGELGSRWLVSFVGGPLNLLESVRMVYSEKVALKSV